VVENDSRQATPSRRAEKRAGGAAAAIVSFIVATLLAGAIALSGALLAARELASPAAVEKVINDADLRTLKAGAAFGKSPDATLPDMLHETLGPLLTTGLSISKEEIGELLEKSTFKKFLANKISSYIDAIKNGSNRGEVTAEEIIDLLRENEAELDKVLGFKVFLLGEGVVKQLVSMLSLKALSLNSLLKPSQMANVKLALGPAALYISIGAGIILFLLLAAANRGRVHAAFFWACISSVPAMLVFYMGSTKGLVPVELMGRHADIGQPILQELNAIFGSYFQILAVAAVALLFIGVISGILGRKK
jgi:hypothetical protein